MKVTPPPASSQRGKQDKKIPPRRPKAPAEEPVVAVPSDHELQDDARLLEAATELIRGLPSTSPERLAELKRRIRAGEYSVDAGELAERLLDEHRKAPLDE